MKVAGIKFHGRSEDLERIAEAFLFFSPQISISKLGAIFIEIGKCRKILTENEFLEQAKYFLDKFGLKAELAIGKDVAHALALATYGRTDKGISNFPIHA